MRMPASHHHRTRIRRTRIRIRTRCIGILETCRWTTRIRIRTLIRTLRLCRLFILILIMDNNMDMGTDIRIFQGRETLVYPHLLRRTRWIKIIEVPTLMTKVG